MKMEAPKSNPEQLSKHIHEFEGQIEDGQSERLIFEKADSTVESSPRDLLESIFEDSLEELRIGSDAVIDTLTQYKEQFESAPEEFFESLIVLMKKTREKNGLELQAFTFALYEVFFSYTPSIADSIPILQRVRLSARLGRIEELRGTIGQAINGELIFDLAFSGYTDTDICNYLEQECQEDIEDIINQFETVYANAIARGEWASSAVTKLEGVVRYFTQSNKPLTRLVAEVASEHMADEGDNPSIGILSYRGNSHAGRLESGAKTASLANKFVHDLPLGYRAIAVSSDVIIGQDTAGMPRYAAGADVERIIQLPDAGTRTVQQFREVSVLNFRQVDIGQLCNTIDASEHIVFPDKTLAQYYAYILGISEEIMETYINTGQNISPLFSSNWEYVQKRLLDIVCIIENKYPRNTLPVVQFTSVDTVLQSREVSPFSTISEQDTVTLHQCMRPEIRQKLEEELGFATQEIPFKSLIQMLRFLSGSNQETFERLKDVFQKHYDFRTEIATAFFAASEGGVYGNSVLELCEKLDSESLHIVLGKYNELVDAAYDMSYDMVQLPSTSEDPQNHTYNPRYIIEKSQCEVLRRARTIFTKHLVLLHSSEDNQKAGLQALQDSLQNMKNDTVAFGAMVKALRGSGATYEQVRDVHIERKHGGAFSEQEKVSLENMFIETRDNGNDPEHLKEVSRKLFIASLDNPHTEFKVLMYRDNPVAFLRYEFDDAKQDQVYIGSFNVSPEVKGTPLAASFLHQTMQDLNQTHELTGEVWDQRSLAFYSSLGWEVAGVVEDWHETGLRFNTLKVPKQKLNTLFSR